MSVYAPIGDRAADLALWISETPAISNHTALERANSAFIDTVACMVAAASDPAPEKVFQAVRLSGVGVCSVVGHTETLSAENAAMVNGTAAHALDFDDNFLPAVTHASAVLVPALLALGDEIGASGNVLLDAYVIGIETQAWLGRRMIPNHYSAGWHSTSTIGAIGAAAACARLLALDSESTLNSLSIATSMAGGSKIQFGSMTKPLHAGLAARAGIASTRLSSFGLKANEEPFNGHWGFIELHHGNTAQNLKRTNNLSIIVDGLAQKRFPCCASAHRTLDAIVALRDEHDIRAENIKLIETVIPDSNYRNLRFKNPKDEKEARFSMTYCAAVAAVYGRLTLSDFTPEAVIRQEVSDVMQRVEMLEAGSASDSGSGIWDFPARTAIHLHDGSTLEKQVLYPIGTINKPLLQKNLTTKFQECAEHSLDQAVSDELQERLNNFQCEKVRHLTALLRLAGGPSSATKKLHIANNRYHILTEEKNS